MTRLHTFLFAMVFAAISCPFNSAVAQEGMLYAATPTGSAVSVEVRIFLGGSWSTLFTHDYGCGVCQGETPSLAVDEINKRVYWVNFNQLVYWDIDAGTDVFSHNNMGVGRMDTLAFNPDTALLYGINHLHEMRWIDPADGSTGVLFTLVSTHAFKTMDYNRADNTFYAYRAGTGAGDGLFRIDVLGDQSITSAASDPWGGFVAVAATIQNDNIFVVRSPGSPFPSQRGTLSTSGPPWVDFTTPPNQTGTNHASAFAYWLFPPDDPEGACCLAGGSCKLRTEDDCTTADGTYQGDGIACTAGLCATPCPADIINSMGGAPDGAVNVFDLLELLNNWGTNGPGAAIAPPTNIVDVFDLLDLLAAWGDC